MAVFKGQKFGRLTALCAAKTSREKIDFRCECGTVKSIRSSHVTSGVTVSCGCVKRKHKVEAGDRFGRLTVQVGPLVNLGKHLKAPVLCDCGTKKYVGIAELATGVTRSCGCLVVEQISKLSLKHGGEGSPLYSVWHTMKVRCLNPKAENYANYGGRGIVVCSEWASDFSKFRKWAETSGYEPGLEIDRRDVNGNYDPENCRWTTSLVNANNRRNNVRLEAFGETKTMSDWARDSRCAVSYSTLKKRVASGKWASAQDAVSTPPMG